MRRVTVALAMMACALLPATAGAATLNATPATFASQVSAAQPGDIVLLSSGSYGTWAGTGKAITVKADSGASPSMDIAFATGDAGFTLDGIGGMSGDIDNDAHDITIRNSTTDGTIKVTGDRSGPVLFDNVHFDAQVGCTSGCLPALWIGPGGTARDTKVRVQGSLFTHSPGDGIQAGSSFTIVDSEFHVTNESCGPCHTDSIQLYSGQANDGTGSTILRNYIHDGGADSDGIVQFDGGGNNVVQDNVIAREQLFGMDFGGDRGSRIIHNTVVMANGRTGIDMTSKAGQSSTGFTLMDNVAPSVALSGATPSVYMNNMLLSGASGGNFNGAPVFVGGSSPTTYAGFALVAGSPGKGRASDGLDVGVRFDSTPPPPPPADPPIARFVASPEPSAPNQVVTFDAGASTCANTPCSYHWHDVGSAGGSDFPLGPDGQTSTFTFRNPGTKYVELVLTDATGAVDRVQHNHVVSSQAPPPPPSDRDGDGVPDSTDACPDVKGTQPDGCPPPDPTPGCDQACEDAYKQQIAGLRQQLADMTSSRDSVQAIADAYKARAEHDEAKITAALNALNAP